MGQDQSSFPYALEGDSVCTLTTGWKLYNATRKDDGSKVSVFSRDVKTQNSSLAINFANQTKKIRHPNSLTVIDSFEDGQNCFLVTKRVSPLSRLIGGMSEELLSWGIYQILQVVHFLNQSGFVHGNITIQTVFVTEHGDWKLGGFESLTEFGDVASGRGLVFDAIKRQSDLQPPEFAKQAFNSITPTSTDAYVSGVFIKSLFNSSDAIPIDFQDDYSNLILKNPSHRPTCGEVLESRYFDTLLIRVCLFMEEIEMQDDYEKERFFRKLPSILDSLPHEVCKYKILPQLINAVDYGSGDASVLGPLFHIARGLTGEEYGTVLPSISKWFKTKDDEMKLNLLENFDSYFQFLNSKVINESVYPALIEGFSAHPKLKMESLKCICLISQSLNSKILNGDLLRSLAVLQRDVLPSIRANTTICIGNIAPDLEKKTREKILYPAYVRALKDPSMDCRLAGLSCLTQSVQFFNINETATKIIPILSCLCVDQTKEVRTAAIDILKTYVDRLVELQANYSKFDSDSPLPQGDEKGMLGWAVNSFTKLVNKGDEKTKQQTSNENIVQFEEPFIKEKTQEVPKEIRTENKTRKATTRPNIDKREDPPERYSRPEKRYDDPRINRERRNSSIDKNRNEDFEMFERKYLETKIETTALDDFDGWDDSYSLSD